MRSGPELPGLMSVVTLRNKVAFHIYRSIDVEGNKERADMALDFNCKLIGVRGSEATIAPRRNGLRPCDIAHIPGPPTCPVGRFVRLVSGSLCEFDIVSLPW